MKDIIRTALCNAHMYLHAYIFTTYVLYVQHEINVFSVANSIQTDYINYVPLDHTIKLVRKHPEQSTLRRLSYRSLFFHIPRAMKIFLTDFRLFTSD